MKTASFLLLLLMYPFFGFCFPEGQKQMDTVRRILEGLRAVNELSYHYDLSVSYPDGSRHGMDGDVCMNLSKETLVNDSKLMTLLYSNRWFYKADHERKVVTIYDLTKPRNADFKEGIKNGVFKGAALTNFLDSVVYKHATIKSFRQKTDTLFVTLSFPPDMSVKSIKFSYLKKKGMLNDYEMRMFIPTDEIAGRIVGSEQIVTCSRFKKGKAMTAYKPADFFTMKTDGHVALKKYSTYKTSLNPEND